jgi:hypothetical protein
MLKRLYALFIFSSYFYIYIVYCCLCLMLILLYKVDLDHHKLERLL